MSYKPKFRGQYREKEWFVLIRVSRMPTEAQSEVSFREITGVSWSPKIWGTLGFPVCLSGCPGGVRCGVHRVPSGSVVLLS